MYIVKDRKSKEVIAKVKGSIISWLRENKYRIVYANSNIKYVEKTNDNR